MDDRRALEIVRAYGCVLEHRAAGVPMGIYPQSFLLPHTVENVRAAIRHTLAKTVDPKVRDHLAIGYICTADYVPDAMADLAYAIDKALECGLVQPGDRDGKRIAEKLLDVWQDIMESVSANGHRLHDEISHLTNSDGMED